MKKQTAVKWFYKNLKNYKSLNLTDKLIQDLYKEALQMEKDQIEEVAMYHKDSSVELACIVSHVKKYYEGAES
jgi:hypothetical protein